jgi:hypothetical protein
MILQSKRDPARPTLEALMTVSRTTILDRPITAALGALCIHAESS